MQILTKKKKGEYITLSMHLIFYIILCMLSWK